MVSSIQRIKHYQNIIKIETGILQAATIDPTLTDGQVEQVLQQLIRGLKKVEAPTRQLNDSVIARMSETSNNLVSECIISNFSASVNDTGILSIEDGIGMLRIIESSLVNWSTTKHDRSYLTYLGFFLGGMRMGNPKQ
ncbi:hypothetical protein QUF64_16655 [Anaerolineales bacterium HSG6]|nr:hypothetical protein [Anaerolineales bacterium HSG6]